MLVVSFWSHLGSSRQNAIILSREGLVKGCTRRNVKKYICLCFRKISFRGKKKKKKAWATHKLVSFRVKAGVHPNLSEI